MPSKAPIRQPRSDSEWGPAEYSITVKVSGLCRLALKRSAARKENEIQAILADPTKRYGVHALSRGLLERAARLEIIDHGAIVA